VGGGVLRFPDIFRTDGFVLICDLVVCVYHPLCVLFVLCWSAILWVSWIQVAVYGCLSNTRWLFCCSVWECFTVSSFELMLLFLAFCSWCGFRCCCKWGVTPLCVGNGLFRIVMSEPALYRLLTFHVPNLMSVFLSLGRLSKESVQLRDPLWHFVTNFFFYDEELLDPRPIPKLTEIGQAWWKYRIRPNIGRVCFLKYCFRKEGWPYFRVHKKIM
jgi:hypothetical protein